MYLLCICNWFWAEPEIEDYMLDAAEINNEVICRVDLLEKVQNFAVTLNIAGVSTRCIAGCRSSSGETENELQREASM